MYAVVLVGGFGTRLRPLTNAVPKPMLPIVHRPMIVRLVDRLAAGGVTDVVLGDLPGGWEGPFLVGTIAAAGSGLIAIWGLLGYVRRHDYSVFAIYRLIVAAVGCCEERAQAHQPDHLGRTVHVAVEGLSGVLGDRQVHLHRGEER